MVLEVFSSKTYLFISLTLKILLQPEMLTHKAWQQPGIRRTKSRLRCCNLSAAKITQDPQSGQRNAIGALSCNMIDNQEPYPAHRSQLSLEKDDSSALRCMVLGSGSKPWLVSGGYGSGRGGDCLLRTGGSETTTEGATCALNWGNLALC